MIDGHHRLKICKKHNLAYKTVAYEFECDEIDAKIWMVENQKNRRNLTDFCKVRLELVIKDLYLERNKKIADKGRQKGGKIGGLATKEDYGKRSAQISAPSFSTQEIPERDYSGNTAYIIAENAGVSHDTVNKVEKIIQLAPPEIIETLVKKTPKTTINSVFNELCFRTESMNFKDEREAKLWMIDLALGTRNLNSYSKFDLIYAKQDLLFPPDHGNRYTVQDDEEDLSEDEECKENSRSVRYLTPQEKDKSKCPTRLSAKAIGTSHDTYNKIKYLKQNAPEEVKADLKSGKITVNKAYQQQTTEERATLK